MTDSLSLNYSFQKYYKPMAKVTKGGESRKISFGKRKKGKAQKTRGPKDKPISKYRGQGK